VAFTKYCINTDTGTDLRLGAANLLHWTDPALRSYVAPGDVGSSVTINSIEAYARYGADATKHIKIGLYDTGGNRVAYTGGILIDNAALAWKGGAATGTLTGGTAYVPAALTESNDTYLATSDSSNNYLKYKTSVTYSTGLPATFPTPTSQTTRCICVRASVTYTVTDPRTGSPITVDDIWDMSSGNNTDALTPTNVGAQLHVNNGTVTCDPDPTTTFLVATGLSSVPSGAVLVGSTICTPSDTRGWSFDHSNGDEEVRYTWTSPPTDLVVGYPFVEGLPAAATSNYDFLVIRMATHGASINLNTNVGGNSLRVESDWNGTEWGANIPVTSGVQYWITVRAHIVVSGGTSVFTLRVYDMFDWHLVGESEVSIEDNVPISSLSVGQEASSYTPAGTSYWRPIRYSFTAGAWPLLPGLDTPYNTVLPEITGTPTVGETLSVDDGTWGGSPSTYAYQWGQCDSDGSNWADIGGATAATYDLVAGDEGEYVACRVTATNTFGNSAPAQADVVGPIETTGGGATGSAYGQQTPDADETAKSWTTWKAEGGGAVTVNGDPDWGSVEVPSGTPVYGPVEDTGDVTEKRFTVQQNKYGTGSGVAKAYLRGQATTFLWNDVSPTWTEYTTSVVATWRYAQAKLEYVS
jgi:hypothetical protein